VADVAGARQFVYREARLLEQRLLASLLDDGPSTGVVTVVTAYANDDGGLGHGLEPDVRCPQSQPLFVAFGLEVLEAVGEAPEALLRRCCDFLASVSDANGAIPVLLPSFVDFPHAEHWTDANLGRSLDRALGIAASLHALEFRHEWRDRVTDSALASLDERPPNDAHLIRDALRLAAAVGDDGRVVALVGQLADAAYYKADPSSSEYGLTPLQVAPSADWARELFDDIVLDAHLDALEREQQSDGGWPISWQPPSEASRLEWRGFRTVDALRTLGEYGRLSS
jgi:hypothetical protein